MKPYYQDDFVTLYHGDCREVLEGMEPKSVDCVITDPPYDDRTHRGTKTNKGKGHGVKAVLFDSFTHERQIETFAELGRITRRWVISTLATSTAFKFDICPPWASLPSRRRLGQAQPDAADQRGSTRTRLGARRVHAS